MEVSTTDIDWLSSEFHDLLATKTTGVALAAVRSLEDTEINGIVGLQLLEGPSARPLAAEGFGPRRVGNAPCAGLEDHGTRQPFHRGKATRRSSNEAERRSFTMTSRRMPCGNMMRKEILDAVDLQTQCRTFADIRDCRVQQACNVGAVCHPAKEFGTSNARTSMHAPTATNTTGPIPMDLSFFVANLLEKGVGRRIVAQRTARSVIVTNTSMTRTATVTSSMRSGTRANVVGGRVRGKATCETRMEERVQELGC